MESGRIWFRVESMTGFCTSGVVSLAFAMYMNVNPGISFHEFRSFLNLYTNKWAERTFLQFVSYF